MTEVVDTAGPSRAGVPPAPRGLRPGGLVAAGAWVVTIAGFVVYLGNVDSFAEAYGGVATAIVLLLWMTLFSVLYYATANLRRRSSSTAALAHRIPVETPHEPPSPLTDRVNRVVVPSAALRNPVAQGHMMSVLGAGAAGISERETDMMDWGFAFGVAWAVAHSQDPAAPEEILSERALNATQVVYQEYRGSVSPPLEPIAARPSNGTRGASATHAHTDRGRAPDARDLRP